MVIHDGIPVALQEQAAVVPMEKVLAAPVAGTESDAGVTV